MLNTHALRTLLGEVCPVEAAPNSVLNHHANGVDYLCLHRSPKLTLKLYLLDGAKNGNSNWLVHPHTHRYSFNSTVLAGAVRHVTFQRNKKRSDWVECRYNPDTRDLVTGAQIGLEAHADLHVPGTSYFVDPMDIHTLQVVPSAGPTLIALEQFSDVKQSTEIYFPVGSSMSWADSYIPSHEQTRQLIDRCRRLL